MGKKSRTKGAVGEREVTTLARELGFPLARRVAPMQAGYSQDYPDVDGIHPLWCEVKRYRRVPVNGFLRELLAHDRPGFVPVLAHRDDGGEWCASLRLEDLLKLVKLAYRVPEPTTDKEELW